MDERITHAEDLPHGLEVVRAWRDNAIAWSSTRRYLEWVRRFHADCCRRGVEPVEQLREDAVRRWAARYIRARRTDPRETKRVIHTALRAEKPKRKYLVGHQAGLLNLVSGLPQGMIDGIFQKRV